MASKSSKGKKSTQRKLTAILCADRGAVQRLMTEAFAGVKGKHPVIPCRVGR